MTYRLTLKKHADLMDRMAEAAGVDLEQAMMEGRMTVDDLGDAVYACTGCANPGACEHWLINHTDSTQDAPPEYCRNAQMMERLKRGDHA